MIPDNYNVSLNIGDRVQQNDGNGNYKEYTITGFVLHLGMIFVKVIDGNSEKLLKAAYLYKIS
jgi:hypothetical protein